MRACAEPGPDSLEARRRSFQSSLLQEALVEEAGDCVRAARRLGLALEEFLGLCRQCGTGGPGAQVA
jgi:hypothetical protein